MVKGKRENGPTEAPYQLPDMAFIRSKIPIFEVAIALGLKLAGRSTAHCWRIQQHQNGDRTPSISFRKNKATCYVCDRHPLSSIDLVMAHQQCDLISAARWICARFDVPNIPKGKKLVRPERWHPGRLVQRVSRLRKSFGVDCGQVSVTPSARCCQCSAVSRTPPLEKSRFRTGD